MPIDEIAVELAYRYCPRFLAGQLRLANNRELASLGLGSKVYKVEDALFGPAEIVGFDRYDGAVSFGGSAKGCRVIVTKSRTPALMNKLKDGLSATGLQFEPDAAKTGQRGPLTVAYFKAPVDGNFLNVELVGHGNDASAGLFYTAE